MDQTTFRMMMSSPVTGPALARYPLRNSATDPTEPSCPARSTPGYSFTPFVGINTTVPITDMSYMFNYRSFNDPDIALWDTSQVTNMELMFFFTSGSFNQPIGNWNVGNVTNMNNMFQGCTAFNQPLNNWNVSKVTTMQCLFQETFYNQPIGSWNTANVVDMVQMFAFNGAFNQPLARNGIQWNTSRVISMNNMFSECTAFNGNISNWNVGNVTDMEFMFSGAQVFNQNISTWNVGNVVNMNNMFASANAFNQNLSPWVTKLTTQPTSFSTGANTTFANNANNLKPFLQGGTIRINT